MRGRRSGEGSADGREIYGNKRSELVWIVGLLGYEPGLADEAACDGLALLF